ncbi:MAG: ADP-ribosylglycohydrolase family protein [Candidatus Latescibacterota bacterium]
MAIKTSKTDPIRVDWIAPGAGWGRIGMTYCPGKYHPDARSGSWDRDLDTDLEDLRLWGGRHMVSILSDSEMDILKVTSMRSRIQKHGMSWTQMAPDTLVSLDPASQYMWTSTSQMVLDALSAGEDVIINCKNGTGKTGTFVSALLAQNGLEPDHAMAYVGHARQATSPKTHDQRLISKHAVADGVFTGGVAKFGSWTRAWAPTLLDKFKGCLLGGAVGDAMGAAVEFHSNDEIQEKFGPDGICEYAEAYGRLGAITDDTQMTMFTAEGVIRSWMRWLNRGISSPEMVIRHPYYRWLHTQGTRPARANTFPISYDKHVLSGWLIDIDELHSARAPGGTCLEALERCAPVVESKGCGGVMRVAPIGLFSATRQFNGSPFELGADAAKITHGHPTGYLAAGAMAEIIFRLTDSDVEIYDACADVIKLLESQQGSAETISALNAALNAAIHLGRDSSVIPSLGQGWIAEEALAIGVYAALVAGSFEDGIRIAVNHSGDSDSTGSIAGQILGAKLGVQAIPQRWLHNLELRNEIEQLAYDLFSISFRREGSDIGTSFKHRYPPN